MSRSTGDFFVPGIDFRQTYKKNLSGIFPVVLFKLAAMRCVMADVFHSRDAKLHG